jgi:hypothetical protein
MPRYDRQNARVSGPITGLDVSSSARPRADTSASLSGWSELLSSAPADPPVPPLLAHLEVDRRHGLANRAMLVFLLVWGADCLYDFALGDQNALPTFVAGALALAVAYALNRLDRTTVAGLVLLVAIDGGYLVPGLIVGSPLDVVDLRVFFVLAESVLVAAILLPPGGIFLVAAANSAMILGLFLWTPHTTALNALIRSGQSVRTIEQAIGLQVFVASVASFWVQSTAHALARMDRAEEVAILQQQALARRQALEAEVAHLLDVHVRVANGDLAARARMRQDHTLWQVGAALNHLLARFQAAREAERRLQATERAAVQLTAALRQAPASQPLVWPEPSGTAIDALLQELRRR